MDDGNILMIPHLSVRIWEKHSKRVDLHKTLLIFNLMNPVTFVRLALWGHKAAETTVTSLRIFVRFLFR